VSRSGSIAQIAIYSSRAARKNQQARRSENFLAELDPSDAYLGQPLISLPLPFALRRAR
jgi:hypothetical protein